MKFKISYCVVMVICLLYGFLPLFGVIQLRHIAAIILFCYVVIDSDFKLDKFLVVLFLFLFFYGLSSFITGYGISFINKLFGTYLGVIALYLGAKSMVQKYDAANWIINTLLWVAIVDALVTIGQFYNLPIARSITEVLGVTSIEAAEWDRIESLGGALQGLTAGGLLGGVLNGYFLSISVLFALYTNNGQIKMWRWLLCIFLYFALFLSQERTGFYIGTIIIVLYYLINTKAERQVIISVFVLIIIGVLANSSGDFFGRFFDIQEMRYGILENDMGGRNQLSNTVWEYVLDNPLGGAMEFFSIGYREPHNFIANSLLYGGFFGGLALILFVFYQLIICSKMLYHSLFRKQVPTLVVLLSLSYMAYTGNSALHNPCLATGSEMFYILWGMFVPLISKRELLRKNTIFNRR